MLSPIWLSLMIVAALATAPQRPWSEVTVIDGDPVMRGLPRDAIPALDQPVFVAGASAGFMRPDEYVIGVSDGRVAKAYSTWHLNGHEIVNDTLGGVPIAVTWCPLCFTGIVYDRRVAGRTLSFGVSGMLWRENLVMYDRETDSWWAQASGRAIQGPLSGNSLTQMAAWMGTWREWIQQHPATVVLAKTPPGGTRGTSDIYAGYHASGDLGVTGRLRRPSGSLDAKAKILGFRWAGRAYAVPLTALVKAGAVVVRAGADTLVVVANADGSGGRAFVAGAALAEVPASLSYWFAWRAFFPDSEIVPSAR